MGRGCIHRPWNRGHLVTRSTTLYQSRTLHELTRHPTLPPRAAWPTGPDWRRRVCRFARNGQPLETIRPTDNVASGASALGGGHSVFSPMRQRILRQIACPAASSKALDNRLDHGARKEKSVQPPDQAEGPTAQSPFLIRAIGEAFWLEPRRLEQRLGRSFA